MPRKGLVYGKRQKPANSFVSSTFSWPSPTKTGRPALTSPTQKRHEDVEDATNRLANIKIHDDSQASSDESKPLKALPKDSKTLRTKDANPERRTSPRKNKNGERPKVTERQEIIETEDVENGNQSHESEAGVNGQNLPLKSPKKQPPATQSPSKKQGQKKAIKEKIKCSKSENPGPVEESAEDPETCIKRAPLTSPPCLPLASVEEPSGEAEEEYAISPLTSYVSPLLRLCMDPSGRASPTPFAAWSDSLEPHFHILKIAEASYGEVYRLSLKSAFPGLSKSDESVLKIIALKPPQLPSRNGRVSKQAAEKAEMMSAVENVASEVRLMQRLSAIPGFTNFREVRVLQGRPSKPFIEAWKTFNKSRKRGDKSIFPDPSKKASYNEEQLWAVIEMQDAGSDLEHIEVPDVFGVWDIFWGVALAVAKGEEGARFEHRDLHLGNICVKPIATDHKPDEYEISYLDRKLGYTGLETTLIDYTLSRAEMGEAKSYNDETEVAFLDLEADQALFEGDGEEEYQYDIYRFMRAAMYLDSPYEDVLARWDDAVATGRTWKGFHPQTNLVWLHFVLYKFFEQIQWPSEDSSAIEAKLAKGESKEKAMEQALRLEHVLSRLEELLDLEYLPESGLHSVRDLIGLALEQGWLEERDVIGEALVPAPQRKKSTNRRRKRHA